MSLADLERGVGTAEAGIYGDLARTKAGVATDTARQIGQAGAGALQAGQQAAQNRGNLLMSGLQLGSNIAGSFAGAGLSWKIGKGPVYVRPGLGLVVQDGPRLRVGANGKRTDLGSAVLFEPEIAIGTKLSSTVSVEASWTHISHARLFDRQQNPGVDMMGVRLAFALR